MSLSISNSEPFWPKPLCFALLFIGIGVLKLQRMSEYFDNFMEEKAFWANKAADSRKYDIIFIGDSRTYRSVSTEEMVAKAPQLAHFRMSNMGFSAAGLTADYLDWAVARLDTEGLRVLVIGVTPQSISHYPPAFENQHFTESRRSAFYRYYLLAQQVLHRDTTHSMLRGQQPARYGYKDRYHSDGWVEADLGEGDRTVSTGSAAQGLPKDDGGLQKYVVSAEDTNLLISHAKKLKQFGVKVVCYRPPSDPQTDSGEDSLMLIGFESLQKQLEGVGVDWIDVPNRESYRSYDGSHLYPESAKKFSRDFGQELFTVLNSGGAIAHHKLDAAR